jgi:hypothetical protein
LFFLDQPEDAPALGRSDWTRAEFYSVKKGLITQSEINTRIEKLTEIEDERFKLFDDASLDYVD